MDFHRKTAEARRADSVLEGEGSSVQKILSRRPSMGNSNHYDQYRSPGQVPFEWELQPGKCKVDPPINVPRIKPPPISASSSMELPSMPKHNGGIKEASSRWLKKKLWRMIMNKLPRLVMSRSKNQARGSEATSEESWKENHQPSCVGHVLATNRRIEALKEKSPSFPKIFRRKAIGDEGK
ncbi:uncharacterized protein LOC104438743 [Eucalyptus grandis]|uniref:uncharacterized protein LOC104438743 n=1 Tax=Eucalyptus grandis TaxID=71139 RepID=UPI00192ECA22|nr:uncharacterized protein LOC104438743 [Eucalyptus grandis]